MHNRCNEESITRQHEKRRTLAKDAREFGVSGLFENRYGVMADWAGYAALGLRHCLYRSALPDLPASLLFSAYSPTAWR